MLENFLGGVQISGCRGGEQKGGIGDFKGGVSTQGETMLTYFTSRIVYFSITQTRFISLELSQNQNYNLSQACLGKQYRTNRKVNQKNGK